jgi:hypothetical protein
MQNWLPPNAPYPVQSDCLGPCTIASAAESWRISFKGPHPGLSQNKCADGLRILTSFK